MKLARIFSALLLLGSTQLATAHGLWLEQTGDSKTLFYGEPENGVKEVFPGKLENMKSPEGLVTGADGKRSAIKLVRGATGFALPSSDASRGALAMETGIEVKDWSKSGVGIVKPMYYARFASAPLVSAPAELALDITPSGTANRFVVSYQGQPVKKAKVTVIAPNSWTQEHTSDDVGRIAINAPWRGQYVLEVTHTDATAGVFEGKKYDAIRSRTMLTFVQPSGQEPGQPMPPKAAMMIPQ